MLDKNKIIRAWKDVSFRDSLKEAERLSLPAHPSGWVELSEDDTLSINGGGSAANAYTCAFTYGYCPPNTATQCAGGTRPPMCGSSNPCQT